jgi:hypothetical protein
MGEVFDVPVTVSINLGDRTQDVVVPLTEAVVEQRIPFVGSVRSVNVNDDNAALGHFDRR